MACRAVGLVVLSLVLCVATLVTAPRAAEGQPAARAYRIGFLGAGSPTWESDVSLGSLRAGLREHGYVEGQTFTLESPWAEGKTERLLALAVELTGSTS
jgi:hypothetical protein